MTDVQQNRSEDMTASLRDKAEELRGKANDAATKARAKADEATQKAREKASAVADAAKQRGRKAASQATHGIQNNPIVAIAGGIAIGALIAGLLPRTEAEDKAVGNVGRKVRSTARNLATTVKENAREQLDELGLNPDSARDKLADIAGRVAKAAGNVGAAAAESVGRKPT